MIVYNYDADLEVSDTCVCNSLLSWVHLLITVPTRFRAVSYHEWISRCVSWKPCSKQWTVLFCSVLLAVLDPRVGHTMDVLSPFVPVLCQWTVTSDKNSAVQMMKTGRHLVLKWNGNCWDVLKLSELANVYCLLNADLRVAYVIGLFNYPKDCKRDKRWQKVRKTMNEVVKHFNHIFSRRPMYRCFSVLFHPHERCYNSKFIPETKNRDALNDDDMRNKNTWCLVLEKVVALKRASCDRNGRVIAAWLVQRTRALFGPVFWQCSASLAQSAHRCSMLLWLFISAESQ